MMGISCMARITPYRNVAAVPKQEFRVDVDHLDGPNIGWDPVQFQQVGGFGGGIRSVSGVFHDRAPELSILRHMHRYLMRTHQRMMRTAGTGDDLENKDMELRSFRYFDAVYRWVFLAELSGAAFPRDVAEGLVHLFNHNDAVCMAFAVWDEKVTDGERIYSLDFMMDTIVGATSCVLRPIINLAEEGGLTGVTAHAALTHLVGYGIRSAIIRLHLLGGNPSAAPIFMDENAVSIEALQALDDARTTRLDRLKADSALAAKHRGMLDFFEEFSADVDEEKELLALVEDARGWCQEFGRRLDDLDEQMQRTVLSDLSISFEDLPLNDRAMKELAEAAKVSHRAYCYLRIFAEHASNEAAEEYLNDPAYSASFKTSLDEGEVPDEGSEN